MSTTTGNRSTHGERAQMARYREPVGCSPKAFKVIVAVMAVERCHNRPATSLEIRHVLGIHSIELAELTRGLWITAVGKSNGVKLLSTRARAWSALSFGRDEPLAERRSA